jgi:hypothetical protein
MNFKQIKKFATSKIEFRMKRKERERARIFYEIF